MHPYFIGYGPSFKKGFNSSQFMNIDVYPLMCYLLGIKPAPNNGSFSRVRSVLADEGALWSAEEDLHQIAEEKAAVCQHGQCSWADYTRHQFRQWTYSYGN